MFPHWQHKGISMAVRHATRAPKGSIDAKINIPISSGIIAAIAASLEDGESRAAFVRLAISRELQRRFAPIPNDEVNEAAQ